MTIPRTSLSVVPNSFLARFAIVGFAFFAIVYEKPPNQTPRTALCSPCPSNAKGATAPSFMPKVDAMNLETYSERAQENIRNRVFRVFLSSTFDDMQSERDQLVQDVFPRIRRLCKERDVEFVPIDLRWGVTAEQGRQGKTLGVCLREVERSRPFFFGFVGERYGWKPKKEEIDSSVFKDFDFLEENVKNGLSICEIGFQFGALNETTTTNARFWLRSDKMETSPKHQEKDEDSAKKLKSFKKKLRDQKKYPVADYDSPEDLGTQVEAVLKELLDKYFPATAKYSWLQKQDDEQAAFERYRKRLYVAGQNDYDALSAFVKSNDQTQAVVGASGLGKSALLANWKDVCAKEFPDVKIVAHYVSASENSDLPANILRRLTESLDPNVATEKESSLDLKFEQKTLDDFSNEFDATVRRFLGDNPEKRLLFIIDGLNQLSETDDAKELSWLPRLPERAQYLLSTVDSDHTLEAIERRGWNRCEIKELDKERREKIVEDFLKSRGRALTPEQAEKISSFSLASSPLVLKTLLDELCVFGIFEKFDEEIDRYVGAESVDDFFDKVFERLESNDQFIETNPQKRKGIVEKLALLLAVARFGLTENELGALSDYDDSLTVSTFLCALDAQLVNRSGRYAFAHDFIRQAVLKRYAKKIVETRRLLIDKFSTPEAENERRLQEVPFQYLQLKSWKELRLFLLDFDVLEKLYNFTFNCDFCMYWNAAKRNRRKEFKFNAYLELNPSEPSQWHNLADIAAKYKEFSTAENVYQEALVLYRALAEENPNAYNQDLAGTLNNLANLHYSTNRLSEAEKEYKEALKIRRALAEENSYAYKPDLANTLLNLAHLYSDRKEYEDAANCVSEAIAIYAEFDKIRPVYAERLKDARDLQKTIRENSES